MKHSAFASYDERSERMRVFRFYVLESLSPFPKILRFGKTPSKKKHDIGRDSPISAPAKNSDLLRVVRASVDAPRFPKLRLMKERFFDVLIDSTEALTRLVRRLKGATA